jgi:hypothetical protein
MRTQASDNEIALGCDEIEFSCAHHDCGDKPTGLWKDPNSTASALALCDVHIETDSSEAAICVMELGGADSNNQRER